MDELKIWNDNLEIDEEKLVTNENVKRFIMLSLVNPSDWKGDDAKFMAACLLAFRSIRAKEDGSTYSANISQKNVKKYYTAFNESPDAELNYYAMFQKIFPGYVGENVDSDKFEELFNSLFNDCFIEKKISVDDFSAVYDMLRATDDMATYLTFKIDDYSYDDKKEIFMAIVSSPKFKVDIEEPIDLEKIETFFMSKFDGLLPEDLFKDILSSSEFISMFVLKTLKDSDYSRQLEEAIKLEKQTESGASSRFRTVTLSWLISSTMRGRFDDILCDFCSTDRNFRLGYLSKINGCYSTARVLKSNPIVTNEGVLDNSMYPRTKKFGVDAVNIPDCFAQEGLVYDPNLSGDPYDTTLFITGSHLYPQVSIPTPKKGETNIRFLVYSDLHLDRISPGETISKKAAFNRNVEAFAVFKNAVIRDLVDRKVHIDGVVVLGDTDDFYNWKELSSTLSRDSRFSGYAFKEDANDLAEMFTEKSKELNLSVIYNEDEIEMSLEPSFTVGILGNHEMLLGRTLEDVLSVYSPIMSSLGNDAMVIGNGAATIRINDQFVALAHEDSYSSKVSVVPCDRGYKTFINRDIEKAEMISIAPYDLYLRLCTEYVKLNGGISAFSLIPGTSSKRDLFKEVNFALRAVNPSVYKLMRPFISCDSYEDKGKSRKALQSRPYFANYIKIENGKLTFDPTADSAVFGYDQKKFGNRSFDAFLSANPRLIKEIGGKNPLYTRSGDFAPVTSMVGHVHCALRENSAGHLMNRIESHNNMVYPGESISTFYGDAFVQTSPGAFHASATIVNLHVRDGFVDSVGYTTYSSQINTNSSPIKLTKFYSGKGEGIRGGDYEEVVHKK